MSRLGESHHLCRKKRSTLVLTHVNLSLTPTVFVVFDGINHIDTFDHGRKLFSVFHCLFKSI